MASRCGSRQELVLDVRIHSPLSLSTAGMSVPNQASLPALPSPCPRLLSPGGRVRPSAAVTSPQMLILPPFRPVAPSEFYGLCDTVGAGGRLTASPARLLLLHSAPGSALAAPRATPAGRPARSGTDS